MSDLCIVTRTTSNRKWLYDITNPTKTKYCNIFGCCYEFQCQDDFTSHCDAYWRKVDCVSNLLDRFKYVMWMDDDAGFVRFDFDILKHFNECGKTLFVCEDENGINAGVYCVRSGYKAKNLINFQSSVRKASSGLLGEQESLKTWALDNRDDVFIGDGGIFNAHFPGTLMNTKNHFRKETIIVHIAGFDSRKQELGENAIKKCFSIDKTS